MSSDDSTPKNFTPGEIKILMCIIKHLKGEINSDFEAVAAELGYKDATIAKTRLKQIIRKKINPGGGGAAGGGGEKATPKKRKEEPGRKPKGGPVEEEENEADVKEEQAGQEADAMESTEEAEKDGFT
ncbi:hypothetical protein B0A55_02127 [Friedmanniomyces simplex]|uniref:Uncharacterized protein n=1 Tax=Friedmanniomyces simplex TaxID=329884 RepID=A0A4U0XNU4_9PEZI|nr:hypothetical protein B0A55_02127 [Friedmanniomyces simplex]